MSYIPPLNQIAFSVIDLRLTECWFREGCGLLPAGGSRLMMRGPLAAAVQGLPGAASTCWWLVGRNPWFQIELFQFERPLARPMPADFRPCDIGYTRIGLWVADFDATLERLARLGSAPLAPPLGAQGDRRACVRNPDGVFVELMERDPLPQAACGSGRAHCPAAVRYVTLSTPDLRTSAALMREGFGISESKVELHSPEHEALWGLAGARCERRVFEAGDVLVEVVQYLDPVGKPWPAGYRISDQGILNIAFGARNQRDHMSVYRRAVAWGARPNCRPIHLSLLGAGVVYVNDPLGFSVEILWMRPGAADRQWGFEPLPLGRRPSPDTHSVEQTVVLDAPLARAWAILSDHEGFAQWSGFPQAALTRPGHTERNGYGAERRLVGPTGAVVEQVVGWEPQQRLRYRIVDGSPFICHQGEMRLRPLGDKTELTWRIRFRPRIPGTGSILRAVASRMLDSADRLPRHIAAQTK